LFEITGLTSIERYAESALMAMSSANESYNKTEKLANDIESIKEEYENVVETL
jgi:hypothetical protein